VLRGGVTVIKITKYDGDDDWQPPIIEHEPSQFAGIVIYSARKRKRE
jgi:hypothetical protein